MRALPFSLAFTFILLLVAAPTADALMWSNFSASLTNKYDVRAAIKAKKKTTRRPASVELPAMAKGGLLWGNKEATTTIVMFTDIECPFCKSFTKKTFPSLKKEYIDTSKVRFVIRHFPLSFHPYADIAARNVVCARTQGDEKARDLYDRLITIETFSSAAIKAAAKKVELDTDALETCVNSTAARIAVDADLTIGTDAGVTGTPMFYVIGPSGIQKKVPGAVLIDSFTKAIDEVQGVKK